MYIFLALFIIAASGGLYLIQKDDRKISAILKRQALKRSGSVKKVFASYPQLSFRHNETEFLVSAIHGENGPFTFVQFYTTNIPDSCSFRLSSRSMPTKVIESNRELKKVKIDQPEFDNKFIIRGKDEDFIRSLLTPTIQDKLLELDSGRGLEVRFLKDKYSGSDASAEKFRFDVNIERVLTDYQEYDILIEVAILLYEQIIKVNVTV